MAKDGKRRSRDVKLSVTILLLFLSSAAAAEYSRLDVDVSEIPAENAFLAELVSSRIYERTPPSPSGGIFRIVFAIDPTLSNETAAVRVRDGCAEVRGGREAAHARYILYLVVRVGEKPLGTHQPLALEFGAGRTPEFGRDTPVESIARYSKELCRAFDIHAGLQAGDEMFDGRAHERIGSDSGVGRTPLYDALRRQLDSL